MRSTIRRRQLDLRTEPNGAPSDEAVTRRPATVRSLEARRVWLPEDDITMADNEIVDVAIDLSATR